MRSRFNPAAASRHIFRLSRCGALSAIFACFALSVLLCAQEPTAAQEPTPHHTTARRNSTAKAEKRKENANSLSCVPASNGAVTPSTAANEASNITERSADPASTTTLTPRDSSTTGRISGQIQPDEQANSSQEPRREETVNPNTGTDRQCTPPQGDSLKTALDGPN